MKAPPGTDERTSTSGGFSFSSRLIRLSDDNPYRPKASYARFSETRSLNRTSPQPPDVASLKKAATATSPVSINPPAIVKDDFRNVGNESRATNPAAELKRNRPFTSTSESTAGDAFRPPGSDATWLTVM